MPDGITLSRVILWACSVVVWAFSLGVVWSKLITKVNGTGKRVHEVDSRVSKLEGRVGTMEQQLSEYRQDARRAADGLARLEKGVDDMRETVNNGNLAIGTQLHGIERLIQEKDKNTSNRLVRIETLAKVEQKLGPMPED